MKIKEIVQKLKGVEGIDADVIEGIEGLRLADDTIDEKLKEESAAKTRILKEKKEVQQKLSELESQMEDLKNRDLSDLEKSQKEQEKLLKNNETLQSEIEEVRRQYNQTKRAYGLERIGKQVKFVETMPHYLRTIALDRAFTDVEDLDDDNTVNETLKSFRESHKDVLVSENTAKGSGSRGAGDETQNVNKGSALTVDQRRKQLDKMTEHKW